MINISTGGSAIRKDWIAPVTATALEKLDAAGVVELGFLNMAEFAAGPTGHNVHHGHCRNPWDQSRVTGGSSSGSGASVAARLVYGALGSDTGGSIRLPAAACGVVGMKATYGRVSRAGAVARSWTLDHVGPLTRTIRDNARVLAAIAGPDPNDSTTSEKPVPDYEAALEGGVSGLKIGLALPKEGLVPLDPAIGAAVQAAADALGKLGATIAPVTLPDFTALYRAAEVMVKCEAAAMHRPWMEKTPELYANQVRTRMEAGFFIPATQYIDALRLRAHFVKEFLSTSMEGVDAVILPAPANLAYVVTTSGSTGGPKGVEVAHAGSASMLHWLRGVLDEVRRQGWSIVDQELEVGLRSLSVPVRDGNDQIVAALNVCCPSSRITPEDMRTRILAVTFEASRNITRALHG